jgi:hypothetical protein
MMNCVRAAKASTYPHKHPQVHPLNVNAFSAQLQTRAVIFAGCSASFAERPRNMFNTRLGKATGDPPKNVGPALAGNKRRANRNTGKSQRRNNTKAGRDSQATEQHFFYVTHGQLNAGFVEQIDGRYKAIGADECELGGVGRTKIYQLMDLGKLRSISIGRRRMLVTASIERLVDEMLDKKD